MARLIESIAGHRQHLDNLLQAIEKDHLPQTMIFAGPSGIGKKLVARALAQAMLCERTTKACGFCPACLRVEAGTSEGVLLVSAPKPPIKIEQSREVIEFLSLQSLTKKRVVIFDQAHWLNPQAANALLKILEEPPVGTHFFLVTSSLSSMMATIRSRSQVVRFHPPTLFEIKQKKSTAPEWALRACQGSFEALENLIEPEAQELREVAGLSLMNLVTDPWYYLSAEYLALGKDRVVAARLSYFWSILLRDSWFFKKGEQEMIVNQDQKKVIEVLSQWPEVTLESITQEALQIENSLLANRDGNLVLEEFWLRSLRYMDGEIGVRGL